MKCCKVCGIAKPLAEFHRLSRSKDGRQPRCKKCACRLTREWVAQNKERKLAADRAYYAGNKEKWRADYDRKVTNPEWVEANRARVREWGSKNRERARAKARERYRRQPEEYKQRAREYRARKRGATVERVMRADVWERDRGICGICGTAADPTNWHLDHIVPLIRGGAHALGNVQVAHPACNHAKNQKLPWEMGDRLI
jgi:5-methylcytosine-specific restriction endonuclease McrA